MPGVRKGDGVTAAVYGIALPWWFILLVVGIVAVVIGLVLWFALRRDNNDP
jgi:hypothetical protein